MAVPLAIALAVWGEWALSTLKLEFDGVILFSAALALFVTVVLPGQRLVKPAAIATPSYAPSTVSVTPHQWLLLAGALGSAVLTWLFSDGNRFRPETLLFWFLACALYVWALRDRDHGAGMEWRERIRGLAGQQLRISWSFVGLVLVVVLAAFFRYYQIAAIPSDPTSDIAEKLLDVRDLQNGQYHIFFPRNTGREPLEFYMALPFVQVFGLTHLALKTLTATVSLLTIPLVYLIGREIVDSRFGLLAAFFLAVSKWDVGIARVGLRYPFYPFFVALAFLFLLRAVRRGNRNEYLLCGLATGFGLYGYIPFRAMVLLIPIIVLVRLAFQLEEGRKAIISTITNTALCAGAAALAFVPLGHYMTENPEMFWFRALTRVSGMESPLPPNPLGVFLSNVLNALLMFNWRGDVVWVATVSLDPVLDYVSGGLFFLGICWCVFELAKRREPEAGYILAAVIVLVLPSTLSLAFPGENPSVVRTGGAGPIAALLISAPVYLSAMQMTRLWQGTTSRTVMLLLAAGVMSLAALVNFERYFQDYPVQYNQSVTNSTEIAKVIDGFSRSVGSNRNAFLKAWPYWVDGRNIAFELGDPDWNNFLMTTEDVLRHRAPAGNKLYIINPADQEAIKAFQQRFPEGQLHVEKSATPGKDFLAFFVPGQP